METHEDILVSFFISISVMSFMGLQLTSFMNSVQRSHSPLTLHWMALVLACSVIVSSL